MKLGGVTCPFFKNSFMDFANFWICGHKLMLI